MDFDVFDTRSLTKLIGRETSSEANSQTTERVVTSTVFVRLKQKTILNPERETTRREESMANFPFLILLLLVSDASPFCIPVAKRSSALLPRVFGPAFIASTTRTTTTITKLQASSSSSPPADGDEEFFNFEPDDSDLAKLGEELGDLEVVDDEEEVEAASVVPDVTVMQPLGFVDVFRDDEDDILLIDEDEEEDEIDIAFDGDDDDELVESGIVAETEDDFTYQDDDEEMEEYYEGEDEDDDDDEEEWDELAEDADYDYELEDDDDPNYMIQKERIEKVMAKLDQEDMEMAAREREWANVAEVMERDQENFEDYKFIANFNVEGVESGEDEPPQLEWSEGVAEKVKELMAKNDLITVLDKDLEQMASSFNENREPEDPLDPYEMADHAIDEDLKRVEFQRLTQGATIDDLENLRTTKFDSTTPKSKFMDMNHVAEIGMDSIDAFRDIPENLKGEIRDCMTEMGSASYNVTKWLIYDLDFNVTNLMLAACQHNPKAPILFEHWFPQLQVCERYKYARDGNFSFSWDDAKNADMEELYTYYRGFGYNEIPEKAPGDTGIIDLEELDEDEVQMVDFAAWCQEVYNPEWDRKDFDDDDIKDVDNVFSPEFILPQDPDVPTYQDAKDDIRNWYGEIENSNNGEVGPEEAAYRDMVGQELDYKFIYDKEFTEAFRGHLVVACTAEEEDLDVAEKITVRFEEEFGKQIFVETRVISHALLDDNCFEVWLESYEIELLHSKKRATTGAKDWTGPIDCGDAEIERMVERVAFLISDDTRYSYRMDMGAILS